MHTWFVLFFSLLFFSFCKSHKHPLNAGRETTPPGVFWSVGYLPRASTSMLLDETPQQKKTKGGTLMFWMTTDGVGKKGNKMQTTRLNTLTGNNTTIQTIILLIATKALHAAGRSKKHNGVSFFWCFHLQSPSSSSSSSSFKHSNTASISTPY